MADTFTSNLSLVKPEPGASRDTWGGKWNDNADLLDALFAGSGTGTSVGIHVGAGKNAIIEGTLNVSGTFTLSGTATFPGSGIADNSIPPAKIAFVGPDLLISRTSAGAGGGETIPITAQGRSLIAAADMAALTVLGVATLSSVNVFTTNQKISKTDDGTAAGPLVTLERISLTPNAGDHLGHIPFTGRDLDGIQVEYGFVETEIVDAIAASAKGAIAIGTRQGAVTQTRFRVGAGLYADTLVDKGPGTINVLDVFKNGAALDTVPVGGVVQIVGNRDGASKAANNTIPLTGAPANSDGTLVLTQAITPKAATNNLKIDVSVAFAATGGGGYAVSAILVQSGVGTALAAASAGGDGGGAGLDGSVAFTHWMTAGTTSPITFTVRLGPSAGTINVTANGNFGTRSATCITITEIKS